MPINNATPEAYQLYLEGQVLFSIIERDHLVSAAAKFERATQLSPEFARAWGYWAYCLAQIFVSGHAEPNEFSALMETAERYARLAVKYDEKDYANHWDLAFVLLNSGNDKEAMGEYECALMLFDNETDKLDRRNDLLVEMAEFYIYRGEKERALKLLDRAVKIPDWYRWIRAWAEFNAQNYQGSIQQINAMRKKPGEAGYVPDIQLLLAVAYACAEQPEAADAALNRLKDLRPDWTLAKELERNPFVNGADRKHWEDGMKKAKFS
jgi:tetratricopeptide (TPR) repeat protein